MKLLLLIPNFILLAISGYNLYNEFAGPGASGNIVVTIMHLFVMAICLTFITLIVKSMFVIRYVEMPERRAAKNNESYEELNLQHSA